MDKNNSQSPSPASSDHGSSVELRQPLPRSAKKTVSSTSKLTSTDRETPSPLKSPTNKIQDHSDSLIPKSVKISQSDLQEISSLDFNDPEKENKSKDLAKKTQALSVFRTETIQVPPQRQSRETMEIQRIHQNFVSYQEKKREWWGSGELENPVNCVIVNNLEHRVDEEVLYGLFCKVGEIKRMKLFRVSNNDINSSSYLKSLNIWNPLKSRPHKKRALIEYHAPNYAEDAIKVFNNLKLYNKRIFVTKYKKDSPDDQIHFVKSNQLLPWFDQYFCLDYFSGITDLIRVFSKPDQGSSTRIIIYFPGHNELEQAKEALQSDLVKYIKDQVSIYYKTSSENNNKQPLAPRNSEKTVNIVNIEDEKI